MESNEAKAKKKPNPIIFIIIAVVLLGGGAAAYFLLFANQAPEMPKEYYYTPTGDAFVSNVEGSTTLIKVAITLGTSRDATTELTEKNSVIRDGILEIIRETSADTFKSVDVQAYLSDKICTYFNNMFMPYEKDQSVLLFTKAYITDIVMQ